MTERRRSDMRSFFSKRDLGSRLNEFLAGNADLLKGEVAFDVSDYDKSVVTEVTARFRGAGWKVRLEDGKMWFKVG